MNTKKKPSREVHTYFRNPGVLATYLSPLKPSSRWFCEKVMDYFFMINYNLDEPIKLVEWTDKEDIIYLLNIEAYRTDVDSALADRRTKDALDFCLPYLAQARIDRDTFLQAQAESGRKGGIASGAARKPEEKIDESTPVTPPEEVESDSIPLPPPTPKPTEKPINGPVSAKLAFRKEFDECSALYKTDRIKPEHWDLFKKHLGDIRANQGNTMKARQEEAERIVLAVRAYVAGNKPDFNGLWFDKFFENYAYENIPWVKEVLPPRKFENENAAALTGSD